MAGLGLRRVGRRQGVSVGGVEQLLRQRRGQVEVAALEKNVHGESQSVVSEPPY